MSPVPSAFGRAQLEIEGEPPIECWLNPTTLQRKRSARLGCTPAIGKSVAAVDYRGGNADPLSVTLVLHADWRRSGADVSATIQRLYDLLEPTVPVTPVNPKRPQKRLKTVTLVWGDSSSPVSICQSVDVTTELFQPDGTPLRAVVTLSLVQFRPEPGQGEGTGQNPTTRALHRRRVHTIKHGETLAGIAYHHLKDPARWREIAEANDLDDPLRLPPGRHLAIPLGET